MTRIRTMLIIYTILCVQHIAQAQAQAPKVEVDNNSNQNDTNTLYKEGSFSLGLGLIIAETPLSITDATFALPEGILLDDLEIDLSDRVDVSSTTQQISATYWPLRMLELSASLGTITADLGAGVTIGVQPTLEPPIFENGINIGFETESSITGLSYGLGAAVYLPIINVENNPIILRTGFQLNMNDFDKSEVKSYAGNLTLINSFAALDRDFYFALGINYLKLQRYLDFAVGKQGFVIYSHVEQELIEPWSSTATVVVPLEGLFSLSYTANYNFSGTWSHLLKVTRRF